VAGSHLWFTGYDSLGLLQKKPWNSTGIATTIVRNFWTPMISGLSQEIKGQYQATCHFPLIGSMIHLDAESASFSAAFP